MELSAEAAEPVVYVGARTTVRIAVSNVAETPSSQSRVTVTAPAQLLLVSMSPYLERPAPRRRRSSESRLPDLVFALPALLEREQIVVEIDAYAREAGDATVYARLEGAATRETSLQLTAVALAEFAPGANRLEFFAREAAAGSFVEGRLVLTNTGRAAASIAALRLDGGLDALGFDGSLRSLAPQERRVLTIHGRIPTPIENGTLVHVAARLPSGNDHVLLGTTSLIARSSPRFETGSSWATIEPASLRPGGEATIAVEVRNAGSDAAHDASVRLLLPAWLEAQSPLPLGFGRIEAGTVARGEVRVRAGGREDRSGSIQAVLESRANEPMQLEPIAVMLRVEPLFEGEIVAEVARGRCGEHVRWSLALRNVGDAPAQCVRIGLCTDGAVYVPGSTTLDNALVCDRQGTSPLWNADGLILEDVAPGQSVALACTTALEPGFTDCDESAQARMWLRAAYLDRETIVESAPVTIERSVPVDVMLPYVVRNVTLERRSEERTRTPTPAISARAVSVRAIPARANEARFGVAFAQHVHSLRGLMRHLWALALLCTDSDGDPYLAALRSSARTALRSVFDRLAIKLRMPHYPVRVHDVLDAAALDALAALGEALLARGDAELARAIASPRLGIRLTAIAQLAAPLEGGDAVPVRRYVETLRRGLEPLDDVAVIDGLVAPQPELDDALDLILAIESDTVAQVALA